MPFIGVQPSPNSSRLLLQLPSTHSSSVETLLGLGEADQKLSCHIGTTMLPPRRHAEFAVSGAWTQEVPLGSGPQPLPLSQALVLFASSPGESPPENALKEQLSQSLSQFDRTRA